MRADLYQGWSTEIAPLASQLDKLVNRVLVPSLCLLPQRH